MIYLQGIDHIVLTVRNLAATCDFYSRVLGMEVVTFGGDRLALQMGHQKINLHTLHSNVTPKAQLPTPGSMDLCLIVNQPIAQVATHLQSLNVPIELGIVKRTGARGAIASVYIRDPDGNLIELAQYLP